MGKYLTLPEFLNSPQYCGFASCCAVSGAALSGTISGFIEDAEYLIDNYLGIEGLEVRPRRDIFRGDENTTYFLENHPVLAITGATFQDVYAFDSYRYYQTNITAEPLTGNVNNIILSDPKTGLIRLRSKWIVDREYTIDYTAGYSTIPRDIKYCVKLLVVNLAQALDTQQSASAEGGTVKSTKFDKMTTNYGNGDVIKNVILRDINDLNNLPVTVFQILNRYRDRMVAG